MRLLLDPALPVFATDEDFLLKVLVVLADIAADCSRALAIIGFVMIGAGDDAIC
jgi:hypothetical protein